MKFHTTLFTSLVAIIFLVIVLLGTMVVHQVFEIGSVGELVSDYILAQVPSDGDFTVSIGSIDSSLFTHITLRDITILENNKKLVLDVKRATIKVPAYRFLIQALIPKTITFEIDGVEACIEASTIEKISSLELSLTTSTDTHTFIVHLTNTNLEIALDDWHASLEKGEATITATGTSLIRAQLRGNNVTFVHPDVNFVSQLTTLEFGPTETNEEVIRLQVKDNSFAFPSLPYTAYINTLEASFLGTSLEALLQVAGNVALNATDLTFKAPNGLLFLGNLQGQGQIENMILEQATVNLQALEGTYDQWEGVLNSLQGTYEAVEKNQIEVLATSGDTVHISHQKDVVGDIQQPLVIFTQTEAIQSIRLGLDSFTISDPALLASLVGDISLDTMESVGGQRVHVLLIQNRENEQINAETSFTLEGRTNIPFLSQFSGEVAGDVTLSDTKQVQSGMVSFTHLGSTDLVGAMQGTFAYYRGENEPSISGQVEHSNGIESTATYYFNTNQARLALRFNETAIDNFSELITSISPAASKLVVPQTTLEGNINLVFNLDGSRGRGTAEIGVAHLAVDTQLFNVGTTFVGFLDEEALQVDLATITTEGLRLSYSGGINRSLLFPEGMLNISKVSSGETLVAADFARVDEQVYTYNISSPKLQRTQLDGQVSWAEDGFLSAQALLSVPRATYPVALLADIANGTVTLDSDNFFAKFDVVSEPGHLTGFLNLSSFVLPPLSGQSLQGQGLLDGSIRADVALADGLFLLTGEEIELSGLAWGELPPWSIQLNFESDAQQFRINDILYDDSFGTLSGYLHLFNNNLTSLASRNLKNFSLQAQLEGSAGSYIDLSFFPDEENDSISMGSLEIRDFALHRFGMLQTGAMLQSTLVGETNLQDRTRAHANIEMRFGPAPSAEAQLELHIQDTQVTLEQGSYVKGNLQATLPQATFPFEGTSSLQFELINRSDLTWRDGNTTASVVVEFELPKASNFFEWVSHAGSITKQLPPLTISHSNTRLLGDIPWVAGTHRISLQDRMLQIESLQNGTIAGSYNLDNGAIDIVTKKGFPVALHAVGRLDAQTISLEVSEIEFSMHHLNAVLLEPILDFISGTIQGSLLLEGPANNPELYGTLYATSVEMSTFWTPEEVFSLKNPIITVSEHLASVAPSSVSAIHTSGRRSTALLQLEATIENWNVPHYRVDVLETSNPIALWLPLITLDMNIHTMVSGTFSIDGTPTAETLYGDITVSDGSLSFGIPNLPSWIVEKTRTSIDMTLRTGKNISFIYPNAESPILRATLADNQRVSLVVEAPQMITSIGGELAFRSGEIYYVQKNFYITEGVLKFPTVMTDLTGELLPTLSLRARLREFDIDGTKIDIYLVLQDSNILDLNPRFESIPMRSTNEILELLGQNIVTAGSGRDTGITSVVAVASAATDVVSRLGLLQNTTISLGFSTIIRDSLGLDVFTIRTNLLQNILFDALPGIVADTAVSPLARYLDNTTIYIGKYVLDELYLQGMFHFRRNPLGKGTAFLAEDLRIDTELSVEWLNPLATFSLFTQPEELSVFDLFDTMGFSVTKRFDF